MTRYLRGVASKQIWMVTIAGKQTMERGSAKEVRARVESAVEHLTQTKSPAAPSDLEPHRTRRVWKKDDGRHSLVVDDTVLATLDPT